jgi:glycosyltransferase involved in cell wall biosynthesis
LIFSKPANKKNLLLHYKNVDLKKQNLAPDLGHSNVWEISEIIRVFGMLGWNIELVDRSVKNWKPTRSYDLFISNASGNSGHMFTKMAVLVPDVYKVMYAAGPNADVSNELVSRRYENFARRNHLNEEITKLRYFDKININEIMSFVSAVICIDDNGWSSNTYKKYGKPVHLLRPSAPPNAFDNAQTFFAKEKDRFILFLGNGFIVKGADLVIEALRDFPNLKLDVCGPFREDRVFWKHFKDEIRRNHNVETHGFVSIGSKEYYKLVSRSLWQIHNSAAEGCSTSITTLLQAGIIPVSNIESGVDTTSIGINIDNDFGDDLNSTKQAMELALTTNQRDVDEMLYGIYLERFRFSRQNFTLRLIEIIEHILLKI